jgi:hypothetical protein
VAGIACGSFEPATPTAVTNPPVTQPPTTQPPSRFPPATGPAQTFVFDREAWYRVNAYTKSSRYVLYDNGAFALQYPSLGTAEYRGGYTVADSVLKFEWEGWSTAGPWEATGTMRGDTLTVRYNLIMTLIDFDDAVYLRQR